MNYRHCKHSDSERALLGTWTSFELELALRNGYKVQCVYEIWNWSRQSGSLFREYVQKFLKLKVEASGVPSKYYDNPDKYVQLFDEREGVMLCPDKMRYNAGRRTTAKICLNSLWSVSSPSFQRGVISFPVTASTAQLIVDKFDKFCKHQNCILGANLVSA